MAEIQQGGGGGKHKGAKVRSKKMSTKIDFTPMVDLGFLLITFFMLTTTLSKPKTMELNLPDKDKPEDTTKLKASEALTLILTANNKIYYYFGLEDTSKVEMTSFSPTNGVRQLLLQSNQTVLDKIRPLKEKFEAQGFDKDEKKNVEDFKAAVRDVKLHTKGELMVLIKSDDKAKYKNLVDILDEMNICSVAKYALVDLQPAELDMIKNAQANAK